MSNPKQNVLNYEGLQYFYEKISDNLMPSDLPTQVDANSTAIAGIQTNLKDKVDKVSGKGLSTNDYTTTEKNKLAGIASGATKVIIDTTLTKTGQAAEAAAVNQQFNSINQALSGKASTAEATTSAAGLMSAADKTKLNGIAANAEVNQNAFTNIKVGTNTITADSKTDTLTFAAGDNITLAVNTSSDTITISATDTKLTLDTTLNISGQAADAKAAGDAIKSVNSQFANYVTNTYLTNQLKNYATSASLSDYAKTSALSSYATTASLNNLSSQTANNFANVNNSINSVKTSLNSKAEVSTLDNYVTTTNLTNKLNSYVTTSSLTTKLTSYAKASDLNTLNEKVTNIIGGVTKDELDTLKELSDALTNDQNFGATVLNKFDLVNTSINGVQQQFSNYTTTANLSEQLKSYVTNTNLTSKLNGYVTSTNLTNSLKNYVLSNTLNNYATVTNLNNLSQQTTNNFTSVQNSINSIQTTLLNKADTSALANYATVSNMTNALANKVSKDGNKVLSDNNFTDILKTKLEGIANNATKVTVDSTLSNTSTNAIQTKVVNAAIASLETKISEKASTAVATNAANGLMSKDDKAKLDGIASGAQKNQNAFSNIIIGSTTIAADTATDTLTLVAGSNITLTPDATNDKITIAASKTEIDTTLKTTGKAADAAAVGDRFTSVEQALSNKASTDLATESANGLLSKEDKSKLKYTNVAYGTCDTAGDEAEKIVVIDGNSNWVLEKGALITVKFTNTNSVANPKLNVNNTGAKSIYYNTAVYTSSSSYGGYANRYITYQFDGEYWVFISWSYDANDNTKVQQNAGIVTAGNYPIMLGYNTSNAKITNVLQKANAFRYNPNTQTLYANNIVGSTINDIYTAINSVNVHINSVLTSLSDKVNTSTLNNYVTTTSLTSTLNDYAKKSSLSSYVTSTSLSTTLNDYAKTSTLNNYVTKTTYNEGIAAINNSINSVRTDVSACYNAINNCVTLTAYNSQVNSLSGKINTINNTLTNKASSSALEATNSKVNSLQATINLVDNKILNTNTNISNLNSRVNTLSTNISAVATSLSDLQNTVNNKQNVINGAASTITTSNLSASKVLISNGNGKVAASSVTTTELGYLAGLNTAVQNKFNALDDQITGLQSNLTASKTELTLIDKVNGYTYVLEMANGQLRSSCKIDETQGIACEVMPLMTTGYIEGQLPDLEGLKIIAYCEDGSTKVLEDYTCSPIVNGISTITYTELGITYTTTISLGATTAANLLKDFNYTSESGGTEYTLNGWKQTSNGASSTELNVPNNPGVSI